MSVELTTVLTFRRLPEAEACRIYLEQFGCTVFLSGVETSQTESFLPGANIQVQVDSSESEFAAALINDWRVERDRLREFIEDDRCLACDNPMDEEEESCEFCGWSYVESSYDEDDDDLTEDWSNDLPDD